MAGGLCAQELRGRISDTTSVLLLEEVAIQAIRAEEDAPIAQSNISLPRIERLLVGQDAQFALSQLSPSIISHTESGAGFANYGAMRMRGIDQQRINITLNGVPLNDMLDQGVFFSNFPDFLNSIQSIQVQRGVGTSSNGVASFAGSINFESLNLQDEKASTEWQATVGAFGTYRGSAEMKTGLLENRMAFYARLSSATTQGYREHSGSDSYSFFVSGGYFGDKDLLKFTAFSGRSRSQLAYFPVPLPLIQQNPRINLNFEQDRDDFGQQFAQLQYIRKISPQLHLNNSLYYGAAGGAFPFGFGDDDGNFAGQINYPLQNRHFGYTGSLQWEQEKLSMAAGLHLYTFRRRNWETLLPDNVNTLYDDRSQKNEASAFAKASYIWGDFTFFGDVQVRTVEMQFTPDARFIAAGTPVPTYHWTFLNPKIGITYQIQDPLSAYLSFGRSGREPTKFDIFGGTTRLDADNLAAVQNTSLMRPEFVNDWEGGLRYRRKGLQAQLNLFYMQFQDEIAAIGERIQFVQLRKNIPSSYRRGIELEWQWQIENGLYWQGNATWQQSRIKEYAPDNLGSPEVFTNLTPVLTPELMWTQSVGYQWRKLLDLSLSSRHISEMQVGLLEGTIPASWVFDARVQWNFLQKHSISFFLQNIFDVQYFTYGEMGVFEGNPAPAFFVQPPRHLMAMLHLRF